MVCCCCSVAKSCLTLCHTMDCRMTYFPVLHCLSEFAQTHVHWISDAIQSSHSLSPLLLLSSIFLSFRVFSNGLALHIRWPKYWSLWISHSNEYSGFISFRIDLFDLPAIQGTLKSILQHHKLNDDVIIWGKKKKTKIIRKKVDRGKSKV